MPSPRWLAAPVLGLALCSAGYAREQAPDVIDSPFPEAVEGAKFRDNRDRALSTSVRRFGREQRGAIILGIEPFMSHGRSLNRIKSLDAHGRVLIWIDDPRHPERPLRRVDDDVEHDLDAEGEW